MSDRIKYNSSLRLAQSIASLLAEGEPLEVKEISGILCQRGILRLKNDSAVSRAIREGADYYRFVKVSSNRWAISEEPISD